MTSQLAQEQASPATDPATQELGQHLLRRLHAALRVLKIYPVGNARCARCVDDLKRSADALLELDDEIQLRIAGEFLFVNATRLRLGMDNFASLGHVVEVFHHCRIGGVRIREAPDARQWQVFVAAILAVVERGEEETAAEQLHDRLEQGSVTGIEVEEAFEGDRVVSNTQIQKAVARNTYQRSVEVTKNLVSSVRMGRLGNLRKVKRAVQNIVDQVLNNETSMIGLTTLRDYDEYTFTHSVNVCIFSLSIAKRLGLRKSQLFDLGMAALLHDFGKSRIPLEVLNKSGGLTDEEWAIMKCHPWLGVLALFGTREVSEIPYRAMIVAHEHHMKTDLTGYPKSPRTQKLSMYSKLVAVSDIYDAATSKRVYKSSANRPDNIIKELIEQSDRLGVDRVFVKALINLLGVYPVGTCVILDTYEMAIVHAANPDHTQPNRPTVRLIISDQGHRIDPAPLVDLSKELAPGTYQRSIIKVVDPDAYFVTPSDFFI